MAIKVAKTCAFVLIVVVFQARAAAYAADLLAMADFRSRHTSVTGRLFSATYYVSPWGKDSNAGRSVSAPLRSISKALAIAGFGSTVKLAAGVYYQDVVTVRSGVTITGPSTAVVKGGGAGRIFQVRHDDVTLRGFTVDGLAGSGTSVRDYRDKLVYVMGVRRGVGVKRFVLRDMTLRNAGGECVRLRYFVEGAKVVGNRIGPCGVYDFKFSRGGKNGEGVYIGTAPEQLGLNGAPDNSPDVSRSNHVYGNVIDSQGNECVDIKEYSSGNVVEGNWCTGQKDPESAGLSSRSNGNIFRGNMVYNNKGSGIRFGGDSVNDGVDNDAYANIIKDNEGGGMKFQRAPQRNVCGNIMSGNSGGNSVGTYADRVRPTRRCETLE
jgi:hypothetical protein